MTDSDTHVTFADYDTNDGYSAEQEQQCPHCESPFASNAAQTVIDRHGTSFTSIAATTADAGPFFCPSCWSELATNGLANTYDSTRSE